MPFLFWWDHSLYMFLCVCPHSCVCCVGASLLFCTCRTLLPSPQVARKDPKKLREKTQGKDKVQSPKIFLLQSCCQKWELILLREIFSEVIDKNRHDFSSFFFHKNHMLITHFMLSPQGKALSNKSLLGMQEKKEKWKLQRCVANDCRREARLGSVYCSTACIVRHAQDSLRLLHKNAEQASGLKVSKYIFISSDSPCINAFLHIVIRLWATLTRHCLVALLIWNTNSCTNFHILFCRLWILLCVPLFYQYLITVILCTGCPFVLTFSTSCLSSALIFF